MTEGTPARHCPQDHHDRMLVRSPCDAPVGLQGVVNTAIRHMSRGDARPIVLSGPAGVGKSMGALTLAACLGRPVAVFDVATSGLRLGQRSGLRELPLIPRCADSSAHVPAGRAPVIVIDHPERLPGGQTGALMASLVRIAIERFPRALEHYFGVESRPEEAIFVFTTRSGFFTPLEPDLLILELPGYCFSEKVCIATQMLQAAGRRLRDATVEELVRHYMTSPGAREMAILIEQTRDLADDEMVPSRIGTIVGVRPAALLGGQCALEPGAAIAMAWTREAGTHLVIEARFGDKVDGDLTILGVLGDEMVGAAQAAFHVVNEFIDNPAMRLGAMNHRPVLLNLPGSWMHKKDGRSAGLAMALALYGLATRRPPRCLVAATGELSLGGLVLPVGTCLAKLLGAEREGMTEVLIPRANQDVLMDAPASLRRSLRVHAVGSFAEAVAVCFSS